MLKELRSLLQALPANHHKSCDSGNLYAIIDEAEASEARQLALAENEIEFTELNRGDAEQLRARARVARLRVGTVYRHLQAVQFIFRLASNRMCAPHDIMRGVMWTKRQLDILKAEEADMSRLPWGDRLPALFATTAFTSGSKGDHAVFWPTLLAAHAGLRMEEALQLKPCDVDTVAGIPVLRVQSGEGQHLKSPASRRIIPIHRNLIALGFLTMVEACRRRGQDWLFPDVERCAAKNRLSGTFTKVFTHYRIQEGVYDPRRDFHSLRTNFHVILKRRDCPFEIRKRLMGHELRDVTEQNYDPEGSPIEKFAEWIEAIDIDVSAIRSPWAEAPAPRDNVVPIAARR